VFTAKHKRATVIEVLQGCKTMSACSGRTSGAGLRMLFGYGWLMLLMGGCETTAEDPTVGMSDLLLGLGC